MQSNAAGSLKDYFGFAAYLEIFTLRIKMPRWIKSDFKFFEDLSLCGAPPVDLVSQAQADIGI